ncbi:hypothetical protein [Cohnella sp. AR92]|uniref:hypothetical protein n=1 Tax=Cohnella sp. AR92 TaxID=648716 RepID=UPI000F8C4AA9|nr:hypothetical protein [Cohnella sp. AR92]RUS44957.1 hypothetical protein ELR57_22130 [Cohnella sp. AR92]
MKKALFYYLTFDNQNYFLQRSDGYSEDLKRGVTLKFSYQDTWLMEREQPTLKGIVGRDLKVTSVYECDGMVGVFLELAFPDYLSSQK